MATLKLYLVVLLVSLTAAGTIGDPTLYQTISGPLTSQSTYTYTSSSSSGFTPLHGTFTVNSLAGGSNHEITV